MKKTLTTIVSMLLLFSAQLTLAQDEAFEADIRKFIEITGSAKVGTQVASQMINSFKGVYPDVPDEFWEEFRKEIKGEDLVELVIPVYAKYYTHEDIKGLIEFYETPLGRKVTRVLPQVTQESMLAGQQWGVKLGEKVAEKLREKGLKN